MPALLAGLAGALALAGPAPAQASPPAAPAARPYLDGFCLPVAGGAADGDGYYRLIQRWGAKPLTAAGADAASPTDPALVGQPFGFDDPAADAPRAVVDVRHGGCALIYPGPAPAPAALAEISSDRPPTGEGGAAQRWRKVSPAFAGRPRPPRWFLQVGAREEAGVCLDVLDDLRRRDGAPVSVLKAAPCRLGADERVEAP